MRDHGLTTGGDSAVSVTLGEELEIGDWILDTGKEGIDGLRHPEVMPEDPMTILFSGICCSNAGLHLLLDNAEVSAEHIGCCSGHFWQGRSCGK